MLSPSIGTILPGLGSNKEKHSGRELTGDNMLGTASTKNTQSIDKSTSRRVRFPTKASKPKKARSIPLNGELLTQALLGQART